ncbi:MAG: PTS transporter subunit EIIC [Erysipelotrichaceae bacterium]|jgi:PTS system cellobiose-specific IIC component|nr:PTS transporter subunit EIIC [Erysipelotrichaceae bacterium]
MSNKKSFMESFTEKIDVISGPMIKFGQIKFIRAVTSGMVATIGVTMIGSIFLVIYLLGSDGGLTTTALLPFLKPFAGKIVLVQSLSMGIMAVYMSVSMGSEYAEIKGFSKTTGAVGALFAFILLNYNGIDATVDGVSALPINYWGGAGVITAIVAMAISTNIISFCYKRNIKIKLPDSVPPAIAESFSAVIPYLFVAMVTWGIRTLLDFNLPKMVTDVLLPILSAADNVFTYALAYFFVSLFWTIGLHGDNIVGAVTSAIVTTWNTENVNLYASGVANADLPYVWTSNLNRIHLWVSTCWPLLIYMFMSSKKLPHLRPLAGIALPPAIFCIIEPIMFGLPVVLNPFFIVPFILSHVVTAILTYQLTAVGFIGKMCINLPWASPPPLLGYLGTGGSIGGLIIVFVNLAIGLVIFYPFWKSYEKNEIKRIAEEAAAEAAA